MRSKIVAAIIAISTLVAVPAFANGNGQGPEKANFPMPAAAFKQRVDQRIATARQHMEARLAKVPADKAKEIRAKFDAGVVKVNAEVTKATQDGTVTKEEANAVRQAAGEMRGGRGHRGGGRARGHK